MRGSVTGMVARRRGGLVAQQTGVCHNIVPSLVYSSARRTTRREALLMDTSGILVLFTARLDVQLRERLCLWTYQVYLSCLQLGSTYNSERGYAYRHTRYTCLVYSSALCTTRREAMLMDTPGILVLFTAQLDVQLGERLCL